MKALHWRVAFGLGLLSAVTGRGFDDHITHHRHLRNTSTFSKVAFATGVLATDATEHGFTIWAQVTPADSSLKEVTVGWKVATDRHLKDVVARGRATADSGLFFIAQVVIGSLKPGHRYYFHFFGSGGCASEVGSFRTLPKRRGPRSPFDELPIPTHPSQPQYLGKVGVRVNESTPYYPPEVKPPAGSPNVLLILLDDVGYGASSVLGGPIPTPNFEALAQRGLRYTKFQTTALCSPTRASLLTGRNHHVAHSGTVTDLSGGWPGYDGLISKETASIAEILKYRGYNTLHLGKSHNTPYWHRSIAGPQDLFPSRFGFENFYGFLASETSQYTPALYLDQSPIDPPTTRPNYTLNADLADHAIRYVEQHATLNPDKPWFVYYAPGATHAPHHVPREWIDKFKGKFDDGWDSVRVATFERQKQLGILPQDAKLAPKVPGVQEWDKLTEVEKAVFRRQAEVYAGFLAQTDYEIGRVLSRIEELGQQDDTLVLLIVGDNGGSAEGTVNGTANLFRSGGAPETIAELYQQLDSWGSPDSYPNYAVGWGHAFSSPFQYLKQFASHYGGTTNPLIVSWPSRIKDVGALRHQWHHVVDIVPTLFEVLGIEAPSKVNGVGQKPLAGTSLAYTFDHPSAPDRHKVQYFEMVANRAIYEKGWIAATTPQVLLWSPPRAPVDVIASFPWELYHVENDWTESTNLAAEYPEKLAWLIFRFYVEAIRNKVFPLGGGAQLMSGSKGRPNLFDGRTSITFYQGSQRLQENVAPDFSNKDFNLTAKATLRSDTEDGVLASLGGKFGGWVFYLRNGKLAFHYNYFARFRYRVESPSVVAAGDHELKLRFKYNGGGVGRGGVATLYVDGAQVAVGPIPITARVDVYTDESFDVGLDTLTPVADDYESPNEFKGKLQSLLVELSSA